MGLLSLFSSRKGDDSASARTRRGRGNDAGAGSGAARAGRRTADDYADDTLDPEFPQKQRARRRLIGAVVLTVAAVIVLPIVFEAEPRSAGDNIAVRLSGGPTAEKPKPERRKADPLPPQSSSQSSSPSSAQARIDAQALDAGEELVSAPAARTATRSEEKAPAAAKADASKESRDDGKAEAKAGSGKFVILVGAFSSEEKARNWMSKLKAAKVPAYIERKNLADGERVLLRAGPFSDRGAADAAEKRVRATGLTARVVEL